MAVPPSVTDIPDAAFDGAPRLLLLLGEAGSAAQTYAEAHGLAFVELAPGFFD